MLRPRTGCCLPDLSHSRSRSLSLSISLPLSLSLCLSVSFSLYLSLSLFISLSLCIYFFLQPLSLSLSSSLSHTFFCLVFFLALLWEKLEAILFLFFLILWLFHYSIVEVCFILFCWLLAYMLVFLKHAFWALCFIKKSIWAWAWAFTQRSFQIWMTQLTWLQHCQAVFIIHIYLSIYLFTARPLLWWLIWQHAKTFE